MNIGVILGLIRDRWAIKNLKTLKTTLTQDNR